jgi:hypothetical protein
MPVKLRKPRVDSLSKLRSIFSAYSESTTNDKVKMYIDNLENVNSVNYNGETILHLSCKHPNEHSVFAIRLLLEKGADPNIQDKYGDTPLLAGFDNYSNTKRELIINVVNELIKHENVNLGITNKYDKNAVFYACFFNMPDVAMYLLNSGKSNPCINSGGQSCLSWACMGNMEEVAVRIIELCPDLTTTGFGDKTIIDIAKKNKMTRVLDMLDPLGNVITAIQKKKGMLDAETVLDLKSGFEEYLNGGKKAKSKKNTSKKNKTSKKIHKN